MGLYKLHFKAIIIYKLTPLFFQMEDSLLYPECCVVRVYTLITDQLFSLEFQFESEFNLEFQPKFGIQLGIPIPMGINLGECTPAFSVGEMWWSISI